MTWSRELIPQRRLLLQGPPFLCHFNNSLLAKKILDNLAPVQYSCYMSSFRDSPFPVAHNQWVEGVETPTNCRRDVDLGAPRIDGGVFDARHNVESAE